MKQNVAAKFLIKGITQIAQSLSYNLVATFIICHKAKTTFTLIIIWYKKSLRSFSMQWCVLQTAHQHLRRFSIVLFRAKVQDLRQFQFGSNTIQHNCSYKYKYEYRYYISIALFCSAKLRDLRQFEFRSNFACYPPFPPRNILVAGFQGLQQKHFQKRVWSKYFPFTSYVCQKKQT